MRRNRSLFSWSVYAPGNKKICCRMARRTYRWMVVRAPSTHPWRQQGQRIRAQLFVINSILILRIASGAKRCEVSSQKNPRSVPRRHLIGRRLRRHVAGGPSLSGSRPSSDASKHFQQQGGDGQKKVWLQLLWLTSVARAPHALSRNSNLSVSETTYARCANVPPK